MKGGITDKNVMKSENALDSEAEKGTIKVIAYLHYFI